MIELNAVRQAIADVLRPDHFFAAPSLEPIWEHLSAEETPWEIFRGQLAARHLTRNVQTFETWSVFVLHDGQRSGEPLLSVKLDSERSQVHIVRGLLCWTWEGYHAGDNVYLSREVPCWVRELVGTLELTASADEHRLHDELAAWIFRAVVGLSRLPLTSVEAPLPGFSLGQLAYFYNRHERDSSGAQQPRPLNSWRQLAAIHQRGWPPEVQTKWLEFLLRSVPAGEVAEAAASCMPIWRDNAEGSAHALAQLRLVFNDVALSLYTDFVDKTLAFLRHLAQQQFLTAEQHLDFLGRLLRQLARHLTAYDLVTFHHRGANYPDALLLDAALKEYLLLLEQHVALFEGADDAARLRRRALRLAWLHRRRYEGHPVPDAPTSPGENARILPAPHVRVPEEQILNLAKRKKRLYLGDPLPGRVGPNGLGILQWCGRDLQREEELRELGVGIFIERPLGVANAPCEPDLSPLLANEAYSRTLAERALLELAREPLLALSPDQVTIYRLALEKIQPAGIAASTLPTEPPRVVALADAARAAADFVIVRTLPASVRAFCGRSDVAVLLQKRGINVGAQKDWLVVGIVTAAGQPGVLIRDTLGQQVLQLMEHNNVIQAHSANSASRR